MPSEASPLLRIGAAVVTAAARSDKEITTALAIAEETVKSHVGHLLSKLQVENRAQATVQALKRGLVSLEELE